MSKSLILGLGLAWGAGPSALADSVTLAWNAGPDPIVTGFYVYHGTQSGNYTERLDSGASTTATVTGLDPGQTYYFVVTAYTAQGLESPPSGELVYTVPQPPTPSVTGEIRIQVGAAGTTAPRLQMRVPPARQYELYASTDLKSWERILYSASLTTNWLEFVDADAAGLPKRFYRLVLPDAPPVPGTLSIARGSYPLGSKRLRPSINPGEHYEMQVSENFVTWTTVHEGICASSGPMDWIDTDAGSSPNRYYRVRLAGTTSSVPLDISEAQAGMRLRVAAIPGQHYRVECSGDFQTWTTVHQGVNLSMQPVELVDPNAGTSPRRFYRLVFD